MDTITFPGGELSVEYENGSQRRLWPGAGGFLEAVISPAGDLLIQQRHPNQVPEVRHIEYVPRGRWRRVFDHTR